MDKNIKFTKINDKEIRKIIINLYNTIDKKWGISEGYIKGNDELIEKKENRIINKLIKYLNDNIKN